MTGSLFWRVQYLEDTIYNNEVRSWSLSALRPDFFLGIGVVGANLSDRKGDV